MQIINKKEVPQILDVEIEKLSNLGFGISKYEGYVIFTPNTCPGDFVRVKLVKKNKTFAQAEILELLKPSSDRIEPFCKMQKVCGACQLQFINYAKQLNYKKIIVKDTMHSIFGDDIEVKDVIPSPQILEYRKKIQYPVSETKESKRIIAGYYKPNSHDLVNIKSCPIQPKHCDEIIQYIRDNAPKFKISGYIEKFQKGLLRHVLIRTSSYSNENLVIFVINSDRVSDDMMRFAESIYKNLENICSVGINFNNKKTNLILGDKTEILYGNGFVEEKLCDKIFKIYPRTFFQVNPECANKIFEYVKKYVYENYKLPKILDAYAGISTFGICLSDIASEVVTVEEVEDSVNSAKECIKENNVNNVNPICQDTGKFFEELLKSNEKFDITVLDPPRKGCSKESLDYALQLTKGAIIYVSCNPATLARDLKYLKEKGAVIDYIQPFDMFPHTYHIENVAIINV